MLLFHNPVTVFILLYSCYCSVILLLCSYYYSIILLLYSCCYPVFSSFHLLSFHSFFLFIFLFLHASSCLFKLLLLISLLQNLHILFFTITFGFSRHPFLLCPLMCSQKLPHSSQNPPCLLRFPFGVSQIFS